MRRILFLITLVSVIVAVKGGKEWHARVKGELLCHGHPLEAWAKLKTAVYPTHELVSVFTKYGFFDVMSHASHGGWFWQKNYPGFLLRIKAECGCGGDDHFELPVVPEDFQHASEQDAENHPYDYGKIDLSDCSKRKDATT
uniref:Transthyretin-like family protein n=1 Tax=Panagrellus redivivus TaxID=6233 RepID=A0A7E4VHG6_PANRE